MMDALNCSKGAFYIVTNSYISENLKKNTVLLTFLFIKNPATI